MRFELLEIYLVAFDNFIVEKIVIFDYWNYWGYWKIMKLWYDCNFNDIWTSWKFLFDIVIFVNKIIDFIAFHLHHDCVKEKIKLRKVYEMEKEEK